MVNNERFPHTVKVVRKNENADYNPSLNVGEPTIDTIVYECKCQNQLNEVGDTIRKDNILYSDYTTYAPYPNDTEENPFGDRGLSPLIQKDDFIEVDDGVRIIKGRVTQFEAGNIGIRIWWDETRQPDNN